MYYGCISGIVSYGLQAIVTITDFIGIGQYFASLLVILAHFDVCQKRLFNVLGLKEYTFTFRKIALIRLQDKLSRMSRLTAQKGVPGADFVPKCPLADDSESQFGRCTHVLLSRSLYLSGSTQKLLDLVSSGQLLGGTSQ